MKRTEYPQGQYIPTIPPPVPNEVTEWVYEVRSSVLLALGAGVGNAAMVYPHAQYGGALVVRDVVKTQECGPQCTPATITLELKERVT